MSLNDLLAILEKGGWTGYVVLSILAVYALLRGAVRPSREMIDALNERDKRYEELKSDRNDWKDIAQKALVQVQELTAVQESLVSQLARRGR